MPQITIGGRRVHILALVFGGQKMAGHSVVTRVQRQASTRIRQGVRLKMDAGLRYEPVAARAHHIGAPRAAHDPHAHQYTPYQRHQKEAQRKLCHSARAALTATVVAVDVAVAFKIDLQVGWLSSKAWHSSRHTSWT